MATPYRGVLFDLFGTLIGVDPARLPEVAIGERRVRSTLGGLVPLLHEFVPDVALVDVWQALVAVGEEMARARAWDQVELPSRERFRRTLERIGCDDRVREEAAVVLSRAHMRLIAAATTVPPAHAALLAGVRGRHRVAVVSNFDDTATAWDILCRHGLIAHVEVVAISEAFGLRKPHPALVRAPLRELGLQPAEALFVGDTFAEDVGAAHAAGVDAAWIDVVGSGVPAGVAIAPRYTLRALPELAAILELG